MTEQVHINRKENKEAKRRAAVRECFLKANNGVEPRQSQIDGLIALAHQVKQALSSPKDWDWTTRYDSPLRRRNDHRLSSGANYYHIVVGPRESGKSSVLRALELLYNRNPRVVVLPSTQTIADIQGWHTNSDNKGKVLIFPVLDNSLDPYGATIPFQDTICEASNNKGFIEAFSSYNGYDWIFSSDRYWIRSTTAQYRTYLAKERLPWLISEYQHLDAERAELMLTLSLGSDYILKQLINHWKSVPSLKTHELIIEAIACWVAGAGANDTSIQSKQFYPLLEGLGLSITEKLITDVILPLSRDQCAFAKQPPRESEFATALTSARNKWLKPLPQEVYAQLTKFTDGLNPSQTTNVLVAVRMPKTALEDVAEKLRAKNSAPFSLPRKRSFLSAYLNGSVIRLDNMEKQRGRPRLPVSPFVTDTTYPVEQAIRSSAIKHRYDTHLSTTPLTEDSVDLLFLTGDHSLEPNNLLAAAYFAQMVAEIPDISPKQISII